MTYRRNIEAIGVVARAQDALDPSNRLGLVDHEEVFEKVDFFTAELDGWWNRWQDLSGGYFPRGFSFVT